MLDEELVFVSHKHLEYGLDDQLIGILFLAKVLISWCTVRSTALHSVG